MKEEKKIYVDELSPEEQELLDIGKKVRDAGQDPVGILNYYLEARGAMDKAADIGKQTQEFFFKQWEGFEKAFKGHDGDKKPK